MGELDRAGDLMAEGAILSIRIGNLRMAGGTLVKLADLATARRTFDHAAWLLGASDALLFAAEADMPEESAPLVGPCEQALRRALGEVGFQVARSSARGLAVDQIAAMLAAPPTPRPSPVRTETPSAEPAPLVEDLTVREAQVLRLLVEGQTDREIAAALFISTKTASNHVANILGKLGVPSRAAAAAFAVRHGLV
jgi:DNA-binding CsgD family transcriptional regulator